MFAKRLKRARKASGLSMQALGAVVGVSANAIKKYEHHEAMPSSTILLGLAKALKVKTEYFFRSDKVTIKNIEYRKKSKTTKKELAKIEADIIDQAERWFELIEMYPDSVMPIQSFSVPDGFLDCVSTDDDIESAAEQIRAAWQLGINPIPDMIDMLESKGIMVICTSAACKDNFDGMAMQVNNMPLVVISSLNSGDRQRFTLAHELGHLVLSGKVDKTNEEQACNHFAGAFLLPRKALIEHFGAVRHALELQEILLLKHEFGISMAAILVRAWQCGIISKNILKHYMVEFSKNGWRKQEPGTPYPKENTRLFKQLVYRALSEDYIGEAKAAELLQMSMTDFHRERLLEHADTDS